MRSEACSSDFLFLQPAKIILALLRCSLQSLGEYLKRPDQSASGQFHQHLNTCLLFLCESIYLSFPFSRVSSSSSSFPPFPPSLSLTTFPDLPKQPPALWIFLRRRPASEKSWEKQNEWEGTSGLGSFQKCWLKRTALKEHALIT